ncbi:MAG: VWA domain-containing protein [Deltaproteobacteria bacterium]|nr:VWA domain-containing protein [Deltaproteobacteria bacterium]
MKPLVTSALLLSLLVICSCSDGGNVNTSCTPACSAGKTCRDGQCVNATGSDASHDGDAGEIIAGADAGSQPGTVDAGPEHCAAESTRAQQLPLDLYIMLDRSGSMDEAASETEDETKWQAVTGALGTFLAQPLTGVSVGLQYFGIPSAEHCTVMFCESDADCGEGCGPCSGFLLKMCDGYSAENSCKAVDYATPAVEIAPLPGVAGPINDSIAQQSPSGDTPTSAALQGAIDHAKSWAQSNPQHVVIDIFATDGEPTECARDLDTINAIAAAGANGTPKILTFVIGVGSSLTALNGIAEAGGTGEAFLVDTGGSVNQQFLDALNQIRGAALGCNYKIPVPSSGTPDFHKINVQYTAGGSGAASVLPQVPDKASCPAGKDAWYYDDPANPHQIILCDATCTKVKADSTGVIDVLLGCATIVDEPT